MRLAPPSGCSASVPAAPFFRFSTVSARVAVVALPFCVVFTTAPSVVPVFCLDLFAGASIEFIYLFCSRFSSFRLVFCAAASF